jgi:hypothetical protein
MRGDGTRAAPVVHIPRLERFISLVTAGDQKRVRKDDRRRSSNSNGIESWIVDHSLVGNLRRRSGGVSG